MQKSIKNKFRNIKDGFSVAEMLLVLLILSFLVLALPPIVHKKVEKRITRGEHGRYECWRDPDTNQLMEFYATERNGADPKYLDAAGKPVGEAVTACRFSPKDQAPNAAYFSFQAIGGGSGGAYPIYSRSGTTYYDDDYAETATIYFTKNCCRTNYSTWYTDGSCYYSEAAERYDYRFKIGSTEHGGDGTCAPLGSGTSGYNSGFYLTSECLNYSNSVQGWTRNANTRDWILKYWVDVPGSGTAKYCSGAGFTGEPTHILTQLDSDEGQVHYFTYFYGGTGGDGICVERPGSSFILGAAKGNRFKIGYSVRSLDTENNGEKYFTAQSGTGSTATTFKVSWENRANKTDIAEVQNPDPRIEIPKLGASYQQPVAGGGNTATCGQFFGGNYVKISGNENCKVGPGYNGTAADTNYEGGNDDFQHNPTFKGAKGSTDCSTNWTLTDELNEDYGVIIQHPTFPPIITYKRQYGYDTPTIGYAGTPGTSVAMFIPKLKDDLSFDIGIGGAPGTEGAKKGGNGGNTVISSAGNVILTAAGGLGKNGGEMGSKVFMFGRDSLWGRAESNPNSDPYTPERGYPSVVSSCESGITLAADGNGQIDGCLDVIVARDNPQRFATDSQFYTVLELDPNSRTPSAINRLYGVEGSNVMPGTAGDGGYTFIRTTTGTEKLTVTGHPTFSGWENLYEFSIDTPYTCYKKGDQIGNATGEVVQAPGTVCKPTKGYPGAVVIVW